MRSLSTRSDFTCQEEELEAKSKENDNLKSTVAGLESRVAQLSNELRVSRRELGAAREGLDTKGKMLNASVKESCALREACDGEVRRIRAEADAAIKKATLAAAECERKCALSEKISHESTICLRSCIHASSAIAERFHLLCRAHIEMTASTSCANRPRSVEKTKRVPTPKGSVSGRKTGSRSIARSASRKERLVESTNVIADTVDLTSAHGTRTRGDVSPSGSLLYKRYETAADTVARALNEELMEMELEYDKAASSMRKSGFRRIVGDR